ncbi:DUF4224 domain-containing protein [Cupriavidus basilensis]|uniref:DUF4224 domain-containing protein n=1 Tax=Cupriavidus basilensis TaxID=68895 RepID=UPI0009E46321
MVAVLESPPLELTPQELVKMTGFKRAGKQMDVLQALGIPSRKRPDNTLLVLRMHCQYPCAPPPALAAAPSSGMGSAPPRLHKIQRKR